MKYSIKFINNFRVAIYIRFPFDSDGGINIEQNLKDFASSKDN